jgi:putative ABC transport system permease protein
MMLLGLAIGFVASLALSRVMQSLLFEVSPTDVITFVSAPLILAAIAWFASWLPARRATRVDPITVLKAE